MKHQVPRGVNLSTADTMTVPRAPKVSRVSVPCLDCGAPVGQPCVSINGNELARCHASRIRMSTRLHNATKGAS